MDFLRTVEINGVDQIDDVAQQIAALHAIGDAAKHGGDNVASVAPAVLATKPAQIGKQAGAARAVGPGRFVGGDEGE